MRLSCIPACCDSGAENTREPRKEHSLPRLRAVGDPHELDQETTDGCVPQGAEELISNLNGSHPKATSQQNDKSVGCLLSPCMKDAEVVTELEDNEPDETYAVHVGKVHLGVFAEEIEHLDDFSNLPQAPGVVVKWDDKPSGDAAKDWLQSEIERVRRLLEETSAALQHARDRKRMCRLSLRGSSKDTAVTQCTQFTQVTQATEDSSVLPLTLEAGFMQRGSAASSNKTGMDSGSAVNFASENVATFSKNIGLASMTTLADFHADLQEEDQELEEAMKSQGLGSEHLDLSTGDAPVSQPSFWARVSHRVSKYLRKSGASDSGSVNTAVIKGSILSRTLGQQLVFYSIALAGFVFVLAATAAKLGADEDSHRRRLGGGVSPLMKDVCVVVTGAGAIAFVAHLCKQPLMIGYLLGGVLVGPAGFQIVGNDADLGKIISFGLIFVLFMIGLELDVVGLLRTDRIVRIIGALQFPVCAAILWGILAGLEAAGVSFCGEGRHAVLYCGVCGSISSAVIVGKVMSAQGDLASACSNLTSGILLCQVAWSTVVLAAQPHLNSPEFTEVLRSIGMIAALIVVALLYAKFIVPAMLHSASKSIELLLVMALAWCLFVCTIALLPFVDVPMELGSIVAGACLASFPYSVDFNAKIKYIRDFFLTLFFAGLGTQVPVPTFAVFYKGLTISILIIFVRWIGVFLMVKLFGGGSRLGMAATLNLCQVSEVSMIWCTIAKRHGHISTDTETILIWVFFLLAVAGSPLCIYSHAICNYLHRAERRIERRIRNSVAAGKMVRIQSDSTYEDDEDRSIVLLGLHRVGHMLLAIVKAKASPDFLKKFHVVHPDPEMAPRLRALGIRFTCGNISDPGSLLAAQEADPEVVISTMPGSLLEVLSTDNHKVLDAVRKAWVTSHTILTEEHPMTARELYDKGADYVVRMEKLCAGRLLELLISETTGRSALLRGGELTQLFEHYRGKDKDVRGGSLLYR